MIKKNKKRKQLTNKRKRFLITNAFLALFLFIGIGYSALDANLNIFGNIQIKKYEKNTLYNVLRKEALSGGLAREYTGEHQDSIDASLSKQKIYHWYAENDTDGTAVLDKNNVIFANHCWQMIRTTDTGGVKLLYNGEVENEKCLSTRGNHLGFGGDTITYIGYDPKVYSNDYTYNPSTRTFTLKDNVIEAVWSNDTYSDLLGKYTCLNTNNTCSRLYYVYEYIDNYYGRAKYLETSIPYDTIGKIPINKTIEEGSSYISSSSNINTRCHNYMIDKNQSERLKFLFGYEDILSYYGYKYRKTEWYSDDVIYDSNTKEYSLDNPTKMSSSSDYSVLLNKYSFQTSTANYSSSSVYYNVGVEEDGRTYSINVSNGNKVEDINTEYIYGDNYTYNDGKYEIINPTTTYRLDWLNNYTNFKNKYLCKDPIDNKCSELWYITNTTKTQIAYIIANDYLYSSDVTYSDGKYHLSGENIGTINFIEDENINKDYEGLYTCFNESGECETINYIYNFKNRVADYVSFDSGEKYRKEYSNIIDSTIKSSIDMWYERNLNDYSPYIEDTIYCNNKEIRSIDYDYYNGNYNSYIIKYEDYDNTRKSLKCYDELKSYSTSNQYAKLKYPIGLLTLSEVGLLNNKMIYKSASSYWLASPKSNELYNGVNSSGGLSSYTYDSTDANTRPVISLKPNTKYTSGTGTKDDPYVVDTSN